MPWRSEGSGKEVESRRRAEKSRRSLPDGLAGKFCRQSAQVAGGAMSNVEHDGEGLNWTSRKNTTGGGAGGTRTIN
jgi:hypothetical protein